MDIIVNLKQIGKKKNSISQTLFKLEKKPQTVKELIEQVVNTCVKDYNERMENELLLENLTKKEIDDKASAGKVSFGVNYGEKQANAREAVENALQSFEDGIYRIFIGEKQAETLNEQINLDGNKPLTFVRLTMLAGRLW